MLEIRLLRTERERSRGLFLGYPAGHAAVGSGGETAMKQDFGGTDSKVQFERSARALARCLSKVAA